ncbi:MAG: helix-turn-helix domain-containing protein [Phycisphaerales bacterium]
MIALRHDMVGPESRVSLSKVARMLGFSPKSVARWARVGVRGVVLPTFRVGGRVFVLKADLDEFLAATNSSRERDEKTTVVPTGGRRRAAAEALCDRAGI